MHFDFSKGRSFAQTRDIDIAWLCAKHFRQFGGSIFAAQGIVRRLIAIQAHDIGDKADLGICLVTTRTVDLAVEVAGVNEENGVGARRAPFAFIQKPQRARQRDSVEHVGVDGDHHVHGEPG